MPIKFLRLGAVIMITVTIGVIVPAAAAAAAVTTPDPVPVGAMIGEVTSSGECGSRPDPIHSSDGLTVAVFFDSLTVTNPSSDEFPSERRCDVQVPVVRPSGYTYIIADWHGLAAVDLVGEARATLGHTVTFETLSTIRPIVFKNATGFVPYHAKLMNPISAPCGDAGDTLNISMSLSSSLGGRPDVASLTVGRFILDLKRLTWIRCDTLSGASDPKLIL